MREFGKKLDFLRFLRATGIGQSRAAVAYTQIWNES
jgi:hypothetical protein